MDSSLQPLDGYVYGIVYWYTKLKLEKCIAGSQIIAKKISSTEGGVQNSISRLVKRGYLKSVYHRQEHIRELIPMVSFDKKEDLELLGTTSNDVLAPHQMCTPTTSNDVFDNKKEDLIIRKNNILAEPKTKKDIHNVDNSVDNFQETGNDVSSKKGFKTVGDSVKKNNLLLRKSSSQKLRSEKQAYGYKVINELKLPEYFAARVIKACDGKTLYRIDHAIQATKIKMIKTTHLMTQEEKINYFMKVLNDKRVG